MTTIYQTSLDVGEVIETRNNFLKVFPEARDFVAKFGDHCVFIKHAVKNIWTMKLFSDKYEYDMVFVRDKNYCCASYTCRTHGIMENWTRGNDMIDGNDIHDCLEIFATEILTHELTFIGETRVISSMYVMEDYKDERSSKDEQ